jgi:hypothetical protein
MIPAAAFLGNEVADPGAVSYRTTVPTFHSQPQRRTAVAEANPQPKNQLKLEDFLEAAAGAALRAVDAHAAAGSRPAIQLQPLPPGVVAAPIKPPRIFIGIVAAQE